MKNLVLYLLIIFSLASNYHQRQVFNTWLQSPYFELVIPSDGHHVRVELNQVVPSPYNKNGFLLQFMYPEANGKQMAVLNNDLERVLRQWVFNNRDASILNYMKELEKIDWSKVDEHKVPQKTK